MMSDEEIPSEFSSDEEDGSEKISDDEQESKEVDHKAKAKSVKDQLVVWDLLLNTRIKVQKLLVNSNKLPQYNVWSSFFQNQTHEALNSSLQKATVEYEKLLTSLNNLRNTLSNQSGLLKSDAGDQSKEAKEVKDSKRTETNLQPKEKDKLLQEQHNDLLDVGNPIMDEWFRKTKFAAGGGKINSKHLDEETSIVKNIEQILSNRNRLVRKTQLKRSEYEIIGKKSEDTSNNETSLIERPREDLIDPEIFNDDDFYRQLLRQLVESKTSNETLDPVTLSRRWLEVQKLRSKMKKKIDTKASFMAPVDDNIYEDEAKDALFASLFGKLQQNQA